MAAAAQVRGQCATHLASTWAQAHVLSTFKVSNDNALSRSSKT